MGCLGNSKTEDQRNEEKAQREANKKIEKQLQKDKQIYRATHRLLLLGEFDCRVVVVVVLRLLLYSQVLRPHRRGLQPPRITFWDVVLGKLVNTVTLPLHKAKKTQLRAVFSARRCHVSGPPLASRKAAEAQSVGRSQSPR